MVTSSRSAFPTLAPAPARPGQVLWGTPTGIGHEGAAQVVQVVDAQVHPDHRFTAELTEFAARRVQAQHIHRLVPQAVRAA
nr:hypothetical protein [Hylemonella gracilis]